MATHDPETEVKLKLVRLFIRFKLEETWPRMEEYIAKVASASALSDTLVKQACKRELDDFATKKLSV